MESPSISESGLAKYYDTRYAGAYMSENDPDHQQRVIQLLGLAASPAPRRVLDYGCGAGALTGLLALAYPNARIVGCDISEQALAKAKLAHPGIEFVPTSEIAGTFDVIFSNHVLEHVLDLEAALELLTSHLAPQGWMVHVLPCGNPKSFEWEITECFVDGRKPKESGGMFYYEDPGHLRRLTSDALADLCAKKGLALAHARFRNQFWGAVEWITAGNRRTVQQLFNPWRAGAAKRGKLWLLFLLFLAAVDLRQDAPRRAGELGTLFRRLPPRDGRSWLLLALSPLVLAMSFAGWCLDQALRKAARREWASRSQDPAASEMYLVFSDARARDVSGSRIPRAERSTTI
ncbi:MAG: class I SAM-dependent methyltransferase [Rhodospirillales bacterium]|nr:class I SAM-dependent methyltransferase [Rhodospirillales bacterium]